MSDFARVMLYATLPAIGNMAGVLLAEMARPPKWVNGALLHASAGIALAIVAVELMPRSLDTVSPWGVSGAFAVGAAGSLGLARIVDKVTAKRSGRTAAWMVYSAVAADLLSDGLITGAGAAASLELGFLIAAAQLIANMPGGFAAGSNLRKQGVTRMMSIGVGALVTVPIFLSAALGYLVLRDMPEHVKGICLAAIMGLLLVATVEDLIPEGDAPRPPRWSSTAAFALGFCGLLLSSTLLGGDGAG